MRIAQQCYTKKAKTAKEGQELKERKRKEMAQIRKPQNKSEPASFTGFEINNLKLGSSRTKDPGFEGLCLDLSRRSQSCRAWGHKKSSLIRNVGSIN